MDRRPTRSLLATLGALVLCATTLVACSDDKKAATTTTTTSTTSSTTSSTKTTKSSTTTTTGATTDLSGFDPTATPLPPSEARSAFEGYWSGDWGNQIMRVDADGNVVGAYAHDDGEIVGRIGADGIMVGWWCETPSRKPTSDAGTVEMRLVRRSNGVAIDGRWTYGVHSASNGWHENWDIAAKSTDAVPALLVVRLDKVRTDCIPPS